MYQARHQAKPHRKQRKKGSSVLQAAGMLTVMMALSRILGFVRDISVSSAFGISWQADAYSAAFTIPDLIYFALVGGGLSSAFIPVFSSYLANGKEEDSAIMASTVLNIVGLAALGLVALGLLFYAGFYRRTDDDIDGGVNPHYVRPVFFYVLGGHCAGNFAVL